MGQATINKISLDYSALLSDQQRYDHDGALCCGKRGVVIGRDPGSDLHIDLPYVSWSHAAVSCIGKLFFLEDCESTDGTLLNSQQLDSGRKYQLLDGDTISIGDQLIGVSKASIPVWADLLESDEEERTEECACSINDSNAYFPDLPEDKVLKATGTVIDHSPLPSSEQPVVTRTADDLPGVSSGEGKSLISSFFAGLEVEPKDLNMQPESYGAFLEEMGRALFHAVDGVRKALYTHDAFRNQFYIPGTMWNRSQLNPLYNTKIDTREVMKILLSSSSRAVTGPVEAIREATGDFYLHGIAVPTAIDVAIRKILDTFDWQILLQDFEASTGEFRPALFKKARYWELYCQNFERQLKSLDESDNTFRRAVANAYSLARENKVRERKAVNNSTEESLNAE